MLSDTELNSQIELLRKKQKNKQQLTKRESRDLTRLMRTKASRVFRQRVKDQKKNAITSKRKVSENLKEFEKLNDMIPILKEQLGELIGRQEEFMLREEQAQIREKEASER